MIELREKSKIPKIKVCGAYFLGLWGCVGDYKEGVWLVRGAILILSLNLFLKNHLDLEKRPGRDLRKGCMSIKKRRPILKMVLVISKITSILKSENSINNN